MSAKACELTQSDLPSTSVLDKTWYWKTSNAHADSPSFHHLPSKSKKERKQAMCCC